MHELTLHLQQAGLFKDKLPHRSTMARWIRAALELDGEFTVRFVDEEEGRELNHQFRRKDYATNVLTFDYQREPVVMADIVICPAVLERQAAEQQKPLRTIWLIFSFMACCMRRVTTIWTMRKRRSWRRAKPKSWRALGSPTPTATALVWSTIKTRRRNS